MIPQYRNLSKDSDERDEFFEAFSGYADSVESDIDPFTMKQLNRPVLFVSYLYAIATIVFFVEYVVYKWKNRRDREFFLTWNHSTNWPTLLIYNFFHFSVVFWHLGRVHISPLSNKVQNSKAFQRRASGSHSTTTEIQHLNRHSVKRFRQRRHKDSRASEMWKIIVTLVDAS